MRCTDAFLDKFIYKSCEQAKHALVMHRLMLKLREIVLPSVGGFAQYVKKQETLFMYERVLRNSDACHYERNAGYNN